MIDQSGPVYQPDGIRVSRLVLKAVQNCTFQVGQGPLPAWRREIDAAFNGVRGYMCSVLLTLYVCSEDDRGLGGGQGRPEAEANFEMCHSGAI